MNKTKLEEAIEQAVKDQEAARRERAIYKAIVTPGTEAWQVAIDVPMLGGTFHTAETTARRIDQVVDEAAKAVIDFDVSCASSRASYGFDVSVEMANPYVPVPGTPRAVVIDIDGTMAHRTDRGPYEFDRVAEDEPDVNVVEYASLLFAGFREVILVSGRQSEYRAETEWWLDKHGVGYTELWMRGKEDRRSDCLVKAELFDKHVRDRFHVTHVLDDRDRVVAMWRLLGLRCWQVAEGNF